MAAHRVLAGDVGGTNARLALVEVHLAPGPDGRRATLLAREQVKVSEQGGLEGPLAAFAGKHAAGERLAVCLGVAAPVVGHVALMPGVNMPWKVDADALEKAAPVGHVSLVNDFFAAARGLSMLGPQDLQALGGGTAREQEPVAILGAGTGLGQAIVLPGLHGGPDRVLPTEGGHRDFGPRDELQDRLLVSLRKQHGRVSTERVLSGPGLVAIYQFLVAEDGAAAAESVEAAIAERMEAAPRIVQAALVRSATDAEVARFLAQVRPSMSSGFLSKKAVTDLLRSAEVEHGLSRAEAIGAIDSVARESGVILDAIPGAAPTDSAAGRATCSRALDIFVSVYGAEAANVALTAVARGGIYLAGGIAPAIFGRPALAERFRQVFEDAGRFKPLLSEVPTRVVLTPDLGLLGAAAVAAAS